MRNKFTPEQMQILSQWEQNMRTAIQSNYLRNVGRAAVKTISDIRARQLGVKEVYVNDSCASCILDLLQRVGKDYFEQKSEESKPLKSRTTYSSTAKKARNRKTK